MKPKIILGSEHDCSEYQAHIDFIKDMLWMAPWGKVTYIGSISIRRAHYLELYDEATISAKERMDFNNQRRAGLKFGENNAGLDGERAGVLVELLGEHYLKFYGLHSDFECAPIKAKSGSQCYGVPDLVHAENPKITYDFKAINKSLKGSRFNINRASHEKKSVHSYIVCRIDEDLTTAETVVFEFFILPYSLVGKKEVGFEEKPGLKNPKETYYTVYLDLLNCLRLCNYTYKDLEALL